MMELILRSQGPDVKGRGVDVVLDVPGGVQAYRLIRLGGLANSFRWSRSGTVPNSAVNLDGSGVGEVREFWPVHDAKRGERSIDGKTLCGTLRAFARAVHLLAAVDHQTGCVPTTFSADGTRSVSARRRWTKGTAASSAAR